jgi:hypothetical protein
VVTDGEMGLFERSQLGGILLTGPENTQRDMSMRSNDEFLRRQKIRNCVGLVFGQVPIASIALETPMEGR